MWPFSRFTRTPFPRSTGRCRMAARPALEPLEDRCLPSHGLADVPNDPRFNQQYGLEITQAERAWDLTTGSTRVVVAVIESAGVDYTHSDLYKNIWLNQDEIPRDIRRNLQDVDADGLLTFWDLNDARNQGQGKITDLNGTGYIDGGDLLRPVASGGWADGRDQGNNGYNDDLIGWDFGNDDNDPLGQPHGTHVAGIIAAVGNNEVGVTGVNWKLQIMPVKFATDAGSYVLGDGPAGIYYAVNNGARVSNNSYGFDPGQLPASEQNAIRDAIAFAGTKDHLFVGSAGNQSRDADVLPRLPAGFDLPNIISVAATDKHDRLADFSNFGITSVDLGAPGVDIWSTVPGGYERFTGTSMSAPHVAGAAALILARNRNLSYAQVKALILDNVDPLPDLAGKTVTGGRLNIFRAVSATPLPLTASSVGNAAATEALTSEQVVPLVTEALTRWQAAGVDTSALSSIDIRIADLPGASLGQAVGNVIWLNADAAGWGWFVDPTPWDDSEFTTPGAQGEQNRIDLLTALAHEIGHLLGHDHEDDAVMIDTLPTGIRRMPGSTDVNDWSAILDMLVSEPLSKRRQ